MDDSKITELLFSNDERGLNEVQKKYGSLIRKICSGILHSKEDAEECANDTLQAVWEGIPPNKPDNLAGFICKIARRISISRVRYNTAAIRNSDLLTELDECVPSSFSVEEAAENTELSEILNKWLRALPEKKQRLFVLRYYYMKTVRESALDCGMSESSAQNALMKLRGLLKTYLNERGIFHE